MSSDAEETIKFAIFSGIIDTWYLQQPEKTRDAIFKKLFEPHLKWAIDEYLKEMKDAQKS